MTAKRTRKCVAVSLTVTVPFWMTASEARREIKSRINDQRAYLSGKYVGEDWHDLYPPNDVRVCAIKPG